MSEGGLDAPENLGKAPNLNIPLLCEERDLDLRQLWSRDQLLANPYHMIEDSNVQVQAAIDGQGIMLADALMHTEINNHSLIPISNHQLFGYGVYYYPTLIPPTGPFPNAVITNLWRPTLTSDISAKTSYSERSFFHHCLSYAYQVRKYHRHVIHDPIHGVIHSSRPNLKMGL